MYIELKEEKDATWKYLKMRISVASVLHDGDSHQKGEPAHLQTTLYERSDKWQDGGSWSWKGPQWSSRVPGVVPSGLTTSHLWSFPDTQKLIPSPLPFREAMGLEANAMWAEEGTWESHRQHLPLPQKPQRRSVRPQRRREPSAYGTAFWAAEPRAHLRGLRLLCVKQLKFWILCVTTA